MLDPISLSAVTAVLGAVGSGMANEAGKWAWESTGGFVRRVTGREVPAPTTPGELDDVARMMAEGLRNNPALASAWTVFAARIGGSLPGAGPASSGRPALPVSTRFFTDRKEALKALDREASRRADGTPRLALVHGADGMGTSTLAAHWGAREAARYPDGRLYADLRAGTGQDGLRDPGAVLRELLGQLGVPEAEMPPAAGQLRDCFQRQVAGRKLLIVLDHAQTAAQVRPLLTAAPAVFTVVVARRPFPGLDAVRVPVGPLTDKDAVRLLTRLTDKSAVAAARATLPGVLARCGGSPYALRAAASRLTEPVPDAPVDPDPVRAAAEETYRLLDPATARLYRLMAVRAWPAFDAETAARVTGTAPEDAARRLEELADALLIEPAAVPDGPAPRYRYRPAVRAHAEAAAVREDGIAGCSAAMARALRHYVDVATRAAHEALPESWRVPAPDPGPAAPDPAPTHGSRGDALEALIAESANLIEAVHCAEESGDPDAAVRICRSLWPVQLKAGRHETLLPALRVGVRLADAPGRDPRDAGALHAQLAHSLTELVHWDEAEAEALAAARAEEAAGHRRGRASAVEFLGLLRLRQWRYGEAHACFDEAGTVLDGIRPDEEGAADVPRARALLERHRGRALRGLAHFDASRERLGAALDFFRAHGDTYNTARALTDLAETWLDASEPARARPLIEEGGGGAGRGGGREAAPGKSGAGRRETRATR
ncbi:tetratricopeptide repeat protein, partial [Streptomyces sp. NPDC059783]|uniref:tetratricopeptide repeat protein n=1 Tax=Streptomyces sp. NPDC059783 TaxID=3346944 RepID=UPI003659A4A3